jgi:hypothetical protein
MYYPPARQDQSKILLDLKQIYDRLMETRSSLEPKMRQHIATVHMYEALRDEDVERARQYQIQVYR